jgi:hypothetical protein
MRFFPRARSRRCEALVEKSFLSIPRMGSFHPDEPCWYLPLIGADHSPQARLRFNVDEACAATMQSREEARIPRIIQFMQISACASSGTHGKLLMSAARSGGVTVSLARLLLLRASTNLQAARFPEVAMAWLPLSPRLTRLDPVPVRSELWAPLARSRLRLR